MFKNESMKFGFIVLSQNTNHIKNTINSIKSNYPGAKITLVVPDNIKESYNDVKFLKCENNINTMLNIGLKNSEEEWNLVIVSRGWISANLDSRYSYFVKNEKDILFPVLGRKMFVDADINGLFISRKAFLDIGEFLNTKVFEVSKAIWAITAIEKGYKFKGIVGLKI